MKRIPIYKAIRTYFTKPQLFYPLFFFLIVITINSCKDECSKVTTRYDITPELKDFYFKKGTYWVYEDTTNHVVDSQFVYSDSIGYSYSTTRGEKGGYCSVSHQFFGSYVQSNFSTGKIDSFKYGTYANGIYELLLIITRVSKPYNANIILWLNKPVGQIQSNIKYNGIVTQNINGLSYNNVYWYSVIVGTGLGPDYFKYNTDYYFVPKIGVVKKVEFGTPSGTRTWMLKRYFIQP